MAFYGNGYGNQFASNYPQNSGPPPPPGGGSYFGAAAHGSAYNVNAYGYGQAPGMNPYGGGGGYPMGGHAPPPQQQPMMPSLQSPAVMNAYQQYGAVASQQHNYQPPQSVPTPPSMVYQQAAMGMSAMNMQAMQMQMFKQMGLIANSDDDDDYHERRRRRRRRYDSDDEDDERAAKATQELEQEKEEWKKKFEEQQKKQLEQAKLAAEKLNEDADLKEKMRGMFIDELMRRQEVSGTFEITEGTVKPLETYDADDPVVKFYQSERETDLSGKKWSCEADCEYLRKGMKGLGTDEAAIIHVVATRSNSQRQEMKHLFKTMYGRDLIEDIRSELSGDFRESVMACFVTPARYDAWSVKESIYGLGTDELTLIEIFMTRTNAQLKEMKDTYVDVASPNRKESETLLDRDIVDDTSGDFKLLLRSAANAGRMMVNREQLEEAVEEVMINGTATGMFQVNYDKLVDLERCKREAKQLYAAGEEKWGTDEETFIRIFALRNYYELRVIWSQYVKLSQRDILNSIDRETSGDFKKGLASIVMNIRCRPMYFAERLKACMKGLGTADRDLIRIIVTRSEIDMVQIKQCFLELTKQTLWRWLKDDCSGDYKKLLQAIVGRD